MPASPLVQVMFVATHLALAHNRSLAATPATGSGEQRQGQQQQTPGGGTSGGGGGGGGGDEPLFGRHIGQLRWLDMGPGHKWVACFAHVLAHVRRTTLPYGCATRPCSINTALHLLAAERWS